MPSKEYIETLFDDLEKIIEFSFGENYDKAYGQGQYKKITFNWNSGATTEQSIPGNETLLGDTVLKDVLMMFLRPLNGLIAGALNIGIGLVRAALNILPLLINAKESQMMASLLQVGIGVGEVLLGIVTPFARLYNIAVRLSVPVVKETLTEISIPNVASHPANSPLTCNTEYYKKSLSQNNSSGPDNTDNTAFKPV